jgi:hypothetical protein
VVLIVAFLGDDRFDKHSESVVVAALLSFDQVNDQIRPRHSPSSGTHSTTRASPRC